TWLTDTVYRTLPYPATALLTASINFDASIQQLFTPLLNGAALVLIPKSTKDDPEEYLKTISLYQVDVIDITPAYLNIILDLAKKTKCHPVIKFTLVGGENLSDELAKKYNEICPQSTLINVYGVTEATVDSTYKIVESAQPVSKNIGV